MLGHNHSLLQIQKNNNLSLNACVPSYRNIAGSCVMGIIEWKSQTLNTKAIRTLEEPWSPWISRDLAKLHMLDTLQDKKRPAGEHRMHRSTSGSLCTRNGPEGHAAAGVGLTTGASADHH